MVFEKDGGTTTKNNYGWHIVDTFFPPVTLNGSNLLAAGVQKTLQGVIQ